MGFHPRVFYAPPGKHREKTAWNNTQNFVMTAIVAPFLCAVLSAAPARFALLAPRFSAGVVPLALLFLLLALHMDDARADFGHSGTYPLHSAAADGALDSVNHFLTVHNWEANVKNNSGSTPLHGAALYGHVVVVSTLIAAGADVNAKSNYDNTPLHDAARNGRVAIVSMLIAAGADVNAKSSGGETPLYESAYQGQASVVFILIAAGADVNAKDNDGETPLYGAAYRGHASVVSILMAAGADVNVKNNTDNTPLHESAYRGYASVVSILIAAGADVNAKDNDGETPLYEAAYRGHASVISILIAAGADVNVKNNGGKTPLYEATDRSHAYAYSNRAADRGYASVISILIAAGADVNVKDNDGETPLHRAAYLAAYRGYASVVSIVSNLVAAGADVNAKSNNDRAPLHYAALYGPVAVVSTLIAAGADVNVKNSIGSAPLHYAARSSYYNSVAVIATLIAAGADVNAKDNYGGTPLYRATSNGRASNVSILIAAGGHWGVVCVNAAVLNPAGPSPPCLCESPNVGTPENCAAPSAESCAEFHDPPRFYDASAGECGDRLYPCHDSAIRKADNSGCECPPNSYAHGDPSGGSHSHIPNTAVCHADHSPIFHDLNGWLDFIQTDNSTLILHFISDHDESPNQLAHAIQHSAHRAITILINRGANLNLADSDGDTPLHLAARKTDALENIALVSLLLDKDANPNIRNNAGWRPLDLAYHGGNSGTWQARRKIMAALINGGANWSDECSGGAIPNENYRGEAQVAIYPQCRCPAHMSQRDGGGACECPGHSHSQVNGRCLPQGSAEVDAEIAKMQVELARLRSELVSLNARLSLSAEMPRETVEDIAEQARETAAEIDWRRANFVALGRRAEAGEAPPPVALSDTAAECRMRGGEVRIDSGSGTRICLGLDQSGTFCLVDSGDAFPCRGLFKHVRRCNDVYHRPALNAFICGARCGADETARGKGCE